MLPLQQPLPVQRLAWLRQPTELLCLSPLDVGCWMLDVGCSHFTPGRRYLFTPRLLDLTWSGSTGDPPVGQCDPHGTGNRPTPHFSGTELAFTTTDDLGREILFREHRLGSTGNLPVGQCDPHETGHTLHQLAAHFEIPELPDVATADPARYESALALIDSIFPESADSVSPSPVGRERAGVRAFQLRPFQRLDLARLLLVDTAILAYECGLGKTLLSLCWALLKSREQKAESRNVQFHFLSYDALSRTGSTGNLPVGQCDPHEKGNFDCIIADEAVRLKGDCAMGQAARALWAPYRIALTGTPIKNRLIDFFPLLEWIQGSTGNLPVGQCDPHEKGLGSTGNLPVGQCDPHEKGLGSTGNLPVGQCDPHEKGNPRVLILAPAGLERQWRATLKNFFNLGLHSTTPTALQPSAQRWTPRPTLGQPVGHQNPERVSAGPSKLKHLARHFLVQRNGAQLGDIGSSASLQVQNLHHLWPLIAPYLLRRTKNSLGSTGNLPVGQCDSHEKGTIVQKHIHTLSV